MEEGRLVEDLNERLVEGSMKFQGGSLTIWGCILWMELDMHARLMGGWMGSSTPKILYDKLKKVVPTMARIPPLSSSSWTMT